MNKIEITAGNVKVTAALNDSDTANAIWDALPITARGNIWGDEIYFRIPVSLDEAADAKDIVELGDLGYWAPGHAFCLFFGRTPASIGNEIRPASPVNVCGRIEGDPTVLLDVPDGAEVRIKATT